MTANFADAGVFVIHTIAGIYFFMVTLRFLMQASRVDFYNPICQAIIKITDPPIKPLRRALPTIRGVDFATLAVALAVQLVTISLIMTIRGFAFHPVFIAWATLGIFSTILDIYFFALIIMVIASWIAPYSAHPALSLIHQLTEPICAPARRLLPPIGGLDLSIILVFVAITLVDNYLVVRPIAAMLSVPPGLILGL